MHFPIPFIASLFGSASLQCVSAAGDPSCQNCLTDPAAWQVAENFGQLFRDYSPQLSASVLTEDFTDQTDSVNWLISNGTDCPKPLGSLSFSSRADFDATQSQAPDMDFQIENVYHDCMNVFLRWKYVESPQQVQGISILETVEGNAQVPYLIKHVFTEFNTGARLVNEGFYQGTTPPACTNSNKRGVFGRKMPYAA